MGGDGSSVTRRGEWNQGDYRTPASDSKLLPPQRTNTLWLNPRWISTPETATPGPQVRFVHESAQEWARDGHDLGTIAASRKIPRLASARNVWWAGTGLNRRHQDFQA